MSNVNYLQFSIIPSTGKHTVISEYKTTLCHFPDRVTFCLSPEGLKRPKQNTKLPFIFLSLYSCVPKGKPCSLIPVNIIYFPLLCETAVCSPS